MNRLQAARRVRPENTSGNKRNRFATAIAVLRESLLTNTLKTQQRVSLVPLESIKISPRKPVALVNCAPRESLGSLDKARLGIA